MNILKVDSKNKDHKLIGASVEPHIHHYFTLYNLAKGTSKSKLFKKLLNEWIDKQREIEPDDMLLKELISRINQEWQDAKGADKSLTFDRFRAAVSEEMNEKGLKPAYISIILSKISPDGEVE